MIHRVAQVIQAIDAFFGHGRLLEGILILVKTTYAVGLLFTPPNMIAMVSLSDIGAPIWACAIPFATAATLSGVGLYLNYLGYYCCKYFRIWGATVGMAIWIFILIGNYRMGVLLAGLTPWMLWAGIFGSIWIIRRGMLGLPRPGAVGAM